MTPRKVNSHGRRNASLTVQENDTFKLAVSPESKNLVGGRWVYAIKSGPDMEEKYKVLTVYICSLCC